MTKDERLKEIKRIAKWLAEQEIVKQVILSSGDTSTPLIVLLKDEDKE